MLKAKLNLNALHAANHAASIEQTRYYLNGVYVEIGARRINYIATNGHILFAYSETLADAKSKIEAEPDNTLIGTFIIPSETIKKIKILKAKRAVTPYGEMSAESVTRDVDKQKLTIEFCGESFGFKPIYGTYPDWRRVIPADSKRPEKLTKYDDDDEITFNPALVLALHKAGETLGIGLPRLVPNGYGPALCHFGGDANAIGVVMPMRAANMRKEKRPAWIDAPAPHLAPVASIEPAPETVDA